MQRLYTGMVESRVREQLLRRRDRKTARPPVLGQEAGRVSALLALGAEDFSSDMAGSVSGAFLRGASLAAVAAKGARAEVAGMLPEVAGSRERLHQALGAAVALKQLRPGKVVVVFAGGEEVKAAVWHSVFAAAAQGELPMLFVVPPPALEKGFKGKFGVVSAQATASGVPGIPVDASDVVALYRVVQESLVRARAGGGPALMECVPLVPAGKKSVPADPVAAMARTLLRRRICDEVWSAEGVDAFKARLKCL